MKINLREEKLDGKLLNRSHSGLKMYKQKISSEYENCCILHSIFKNLKE
jgi:hypothetical protein